LLAKRLAGIELRSLQLKKVLLKLVTAVLLSKSPAGIEVKARQLLKVLLKLVTPVLLSKSPTGIEVKEVQNEKELSKLLNPGILGTIEVDVTSLAVFENIWPAGGSNPNLMFPLEAKLP
jgi:hypothetical protein